MNLLSPPRGARPVPGAPGYHATESADVWRDRVGSAKPAHHAAKLTPERVAEALRLSAAGLSERVLARRYGVSRPTIRAALRGSTWSTWSTCHTFPIGGAGRFVRLVIDGRTVIRSVAVLCRAAFSENPVSWAAEISGTAPRPAPRPPRPTPPRALPLVAPPCPTAPPAVAEEPRLPARAVRLVAEPLELAELHARGERHGRSRLTDEQVVEAGRLRADGWLLKALAARYGVAEGTVGYAVRGATWSHLAAD